MMYSFTRSLLVGVAVMTIGVHAGAAVPKQAAPVGPIRNILDLPINQRLDRLQDKGASGYKALVTLMFDENETMDTRWKAVTAAARIGGKEAKPEITRALKHQTWYMRNAGLVAMQGLDRKEALKWANRLLDDKALLVRAAAVDVIADVGTQAETAKLWERLYSQKNFKGGQSLFIRQRIVEALARLEQPGKEAAFVKILNDQDQTLHPAAIQALERSTRKTLGPADSSLSARRTQWLNWWKTRQG